MLASFRLTPEAPIRMVHSAGSVTPSQTLAVAEYRYHGIMLRGYVTRRGNTIAASIGHSPYGGYRFDDPSLQPMIERVIMAAYHRHEPNRRRSILAAIRTR